ncbi:octopamine receptor beta-2R-like [Argiope bruennichi]|uniref:Octopamine receptor beta-1R like protein n=1 Tax=Argiope bruennichi TaxID=94029 RepID=A0A8T0E5F9_ARGBR|nr:octopamine receptor beta-2R-like [Argiope bruennichi]XP_055935265.1 octopamine receptor beta-2R-like [Argiope bruennichi]KAF8766570.1 Octopamine receptor beta-1R like protein [Argiope bruennichi]
MMVINESVYQDGMVMNGTILEFERELTWDEMLLLVVKGIVLCSIILAAILGNLLVIISVSRNQKLRSTTNFFIVSLAAADTLVALLAMTFNAFYTVTDKWIFPQVVCDLWNSCDVLFSTASILHLCCISVDRYYAIVKPFEYPNKINKRNVIIMLCCVWVSSCLISFIPIFTGIYTTAEHLREKELTPYECNFVVNKPYAVVSSCVSFWVPSLIMVGAYVRIFIEATKQEKMICKNQIAAAIPQYPRNSTDTTAQMMVSIPQNHRNSHVDEEQPTPLKRNINRMKREHKAAKTLGIIMGVFIFCWLPFFIWYLTESLCDSCKCPKVIVQTLFWVGYFNSSLNPIIYAYFNREFREAFKDTINVVCQFCGKLCCMQNRNEVHFNCTYRSTQDIGLVENKCVRDI